MMTDLVNRIRANIAALGGSEIRAIANNDSLKVMWNDKQALLAEMNQAKKAAAEAAAKPYLELISEIDQQYAFLLQMIGDNGDDE